MAKKGSSSNVRLSSKVIYAKDNHCLRLNENVSRVFFAQRHTRKIYGLLSLAFCAIFFPVTFVLVQKGR